MQTAHENLAGKDEKYVWHAMRPYDPKATMVIEKAKGAWLSDYDGNQFLDAMAGLWCVNVGYGREELAQAAFDQLKELSYYPLTHTHAPAIKLAEKLNEMLGGGYVIFFSNSGSEANETAFKIARQYHEQKGEGSRHKIVSRYRAYHGNTMGSLAATGQAQRKYKYEPLGQGFLHVQPPDTYRDVEDDRVQLASVKAVDDLMTWELSQTVAAMIMEPIITGGGIIMPQQDYMKSVKEVCENHGALLICDEVICGFGRTGKAFGFMNYDVKPDIVTMAKGLTSGYLPLSATAVKEEIYEAFKGKDSYDHFRHINTFGGNPASCALALKNLEIMEREKLFDRSQELGEKLKRQLTEQLSSHCNVGDIRGKGLLIGIELVEDKRTKKPLDVGELNKVIGYCKSKGVIIGKNGDTVAGYNNVLTMAPPLMIEEKDIDLLVETIVAGLSHL
ncbi:aminotransferase class III-fold pyridoxal phosphate-dependent enzyme [Bacillus hwajinpoensis]|uniref:Aminotransferase class III-fold pyridoxal phosphate-dependent enzyme n=1 Tax=Guptibacillus hwajinpoensis TaxID=208199 RepID=A0A845EZX6_9BACL|nr:aspartate aminotransferase family protein [Pseudalkalibacillus hwajinpoensis]MYL64057.1 aminotransferase class III-fold pyridoxal phosphate-dependent enzyme [Pseudalkalibacillus hwajinpoensis]